MSKSFSSVALMRLEEIRVSHGPAVSTQVAERAQYNRNHMRPYTTPFIVAHDIDVALTEITSTTQKGAVTDG